MTLARRETKGRDNRTARDRRAVGRRSSARPTRKAEPERKPKVQTGPPTVLYRVCKSGWAVLTEKVPSAPHTRFVCPFCPRSHRVPGPVRGFRRVRRPQWLKLRRVFE